MQKNIHQKLLLCVKYVKSYSYEIFINRQMGTHLKDKGAFVKFLASFFVLHLF